MMDTDDHIIALLIHDFEHCVAPSSHLSQTEMERCVQHSNDEIRAWTAKALVNDISKEETVDYLCRLAVDNNPSVRVEAVDSLSEFTHLQSYHALKHAVSDSDYLVRAYAAFGVAYVGKSLLPSDAEMTLLQLKTTETDDFVRVSILEGLYILGDSASLEDLFGMFKSSDYHTQCSILHALEEIWDESNRLRILSFVDTLTVAEYPPAVSGSLKELQKTLNYTA